MITAFALGFMAGGILMAIIGICGHSAYQRELGLCADYSIITEINGQECYVVPVERASHWLKVRVTPPIINNLGDV